MVMIWWLQPTDCIIIPQRVRCNITLFSIMNGFLGQNTSLLTQRKSQKRFQSDIWLLNLDYLKIAPNHGFDGSCEILTCYSRYVLEWLEHQTRSHMCLQSFLTYLDCWPHYSASRSIRTQASPTKSDFFLSFFLKRIFKVVNTDLMRLQHAGNPWEL